MSLPVKVCSVSNFGRRASSESPVSIVTGIGHCPYQRNDPANTAPSEKNIQGKNRSFAVMCSLERHNGWNKIRCHEEDHKQKGYNRRGMRPMPGITIIHHRDF